MNEVELNKARLGVPKSLFQDSRKPHKEFNDFDGDGVPDHKDDKVAIEYKKMPHKLKIKKNFWKDKPLGRTLSLRNDTVKKAVVAISGIVVTTATAKVGIDLELIPKRTITSITEMQFIENLLNKLLGAPDLVSAAVVLAAFVVPFILGLFIKGLIMSRRWRTDLKDLAKVYAGFRSKESESGEELSDSEKAILWDGAKENIEILLFDNGIKVDLDGDGVVGE